MSDLATPPLVSLAETRRLLSCGKTKLNDLCNGDQVTKVRDGGKVWVTMESIMAYVERLKTQKRG